MNAAPSASDLSLLVIDDDAVSREVLAAVLTTGGFRVRTAESGEAALRILAAETPRAVLADLRMPGLGGAELILELRARTTAPIFAISASLPRAGEDTGADGFLSKPFTADQLRDLLVRDLLESRAEITGDNIPAPTEEAQNAPPVALPILDTRILAELRQLMPETSVRQVYETALHDLDVRLNELDAAIAAKNGAKARQIGHALKGGCGMVGAAELAGLGEQLEHLEGDEPDNLCQLAGKMRAALAGLKNILKVRLSEASANEPDAK